MAINRNSFTPERLRRLAANPFVDQKMLQFVKNRTAVAPQSISSPTRQGSSLAAPRKLVISEESAKLIAAAIKAMLRG